ncbi:MAG: sigma factor-like helix-turn-helix DNA-binding protein [Clostridia bacterium]
MQRINLHIYYPELSEDSFIEVEDEIAAAMKPHSLEDASHARRMRYTKVLSLDADDGVENHTLRFAPSSEDLLMQKATWEQLQEALDQLTPKQRRRVCKHYLLGKSNTQIAREEGVSTGCVSENILATLRNLKHYYEQKNWTK